MNAVLRYFFRGLLVVVPAVATVAIFTYLFRSVDQWLGLPIPGLGFLVTVAATIVLGFLASNFLTKHAFLLVEAVFTRIPFIKLVYSAFRDLVGAFVGEKKSFDKPVLVALGDGALVMGFATRDGLAVLGLADHVAIYFPQAYAFAGHLVMFPRERVTPLAIPAGDAMTFVLSGGAAGLQPGAGEAKPAQP